MADDEYRSLPFKEAIDYLRAKVRVPSQRWTDLWQGMHARAFTVAGAASDDIVADFHAAVTKAIEQGTTLEEFRKDFDSIVAKYGWSYKGGRSWRTRVIYDTNLNTAYQAGRYAQMTQPEVRKYRPFWQYKHLDGVLHPRPWHVAWSEAPTILPWDHPWWKTHYCPNGWGCHCYVIALSLRDLKRLGLDGPTKAPASPLVAVAVNTATGPVTIEVPQGIDPGWGYNVGEAAWGRSAQLVAQEAHGPFTALKAPGATPAAVLAPIAADKPAAPLGTAVADGDEAALRKALAAAIGGDSVDFTDPLSAGVKLTQAIVDHMLADPKRLDGREQYFPLLPSLITDPAEIWIGFAESDVSGRVALRRRYVKLIDLGRGVTLGLVADADRGLWSGMTFFRGGLSGLAGLRTGVRVYSKAGDGPV